MSVIDPRIAKRRHFVAEHGARRRLRSMVIVVVLFGLGGLGYWATQSELLDVDSIVTVGRVTHTDVEGALAAAGVTEGMPLVSAIRAAGRLEEELEASTWVRAATVSVLFPGTVEVEIAERTTAAALQGSDGSWQLVSLDGTIVDSTAQPPGDLGVITDGSIVEPALEFFGVLGDLAPGTTVSVVGGELWAERDGLFAKLGRPDQMGEKAAAFAAMTSEEVTPGWAVNLTAPSRPALFQVGEVSTSTGG
jgi:hypothetical protein